VSQFCWQVSGEVVVNLCELGGIKGQRTIFVSADCFKPFVRREFSQLLTNCRAFIGCQRSPTLMSLLDKPPLVFSVFCTGARLKFLFLNPFLPVFLMKTLRSTYKPPSVFR
jgi:hypothetical protein